ncbi:actin-domain-containing protein [Artomyces pyxidatus]|uniref:Actin-domain-containing protein n=1 Tax=Artomyces pyxidatus TaxID=48021 RepID=A0ACB8THE6_9AGAM|nr:actin-domain-containing protein [Artomyces pyxidatus]
MSAIPATPRTKTSHLSPTTPVATPSTSRVAHAHAVQASPHYQTTRRHSLYGTEDRIVIDPGSRIWKVGFSGEGRPRDVFLVGPLWGLRRATDMAERDEEDRVLEARLQAHIRAVFHDSLLTEPKSRKVILVEHPLLPVYVKEMLAKILFGNLQVPSISFASSHLLALLSVGRITGLVLDCGHLESTALPIFSSRPLFPQLRTTPLAGSRLTAHLRALLLLFGTYLPPPTSLSAPTNLPAASRSTRVPQEVLTDAVLEQVKTRCTFVGDPLDTSSDMRVMSPSGDDSMELDMPPSDVAQSESDFSHISVDLDSHMESSQPASSGFSVVSRSQVPPERTTRGETQLQALANMYTRHSTATDLHLKVVPPVAQQTGTGKGTLIIPGWVRERGAEVLFEGGDVDEASVAETILDSLLKVPVDLRKTLASSILVIGGTSMLPGFIPRLHSELMRAIASSPSSSARPPMRPDRPRPPAYDRYAVLRPLVPHFAILNNPSPPLPTGARGNNHAGKAPAFTPATMAWVGGSLAGSLKTGGVEVPREKWDEADAQQDPDENTPIAIDVSSRRAIPNVIPDWTRTPLPVGAPPANPPHLPETAPRAAVGA